MMGKRHGYLGKAEEARVRCSPFIIEIECCGVMKDVRSVQRCGDGQRLRLYSLPCY